MKKKPRHDLMFLHLPGKGFIARHMPPYKIPSRPGKWTDTPLFRAALEEAISKVQPDLFNKDKEEE